MSDYFSEPLFERLEFSLHGRVPVVLDVVVGPSSKHLRDFCPSVSHYLVVEEQEPVLFVGPRTLFDVRVKVVVPSLPALLAFSSWEVDSDGGPLLGTKSFDESE